VILSFGHLSANAKNAEASEAVLSCWELTEKSSLDTDVRNSLSFR